MINYLNELQYSMLTLIVSRERDSNENNNKLIDEFIKKKTDIKKIQD